MKTIAALGEIHEDGIKILKKNNFQIKQINDFSKKNLIKNLEYVDAIALRTSNLTKDILKNCKSLKIVSRHGVGYDNVDLKYLNEKKIALAITGTSNAVSVAEHVMTMFLTLCKLSNVSDRLVRKGKFKQKKTIPDFFELFDKNIFIVGFGRIGQALAKRCNGFESKVFVYDPFVDSKNIKASGCTPIKFAKGIKIADFISVHLPLNNKTKHMISKKELSKMKKTCILVNTARGGIIKESALVWALKNKIIHSAGLDVFEKEPPEKNNPLFSMDNIILSPHNAALTIECRKRMAVETCENIINYLKNKSKLNIKNIVNKKIY